MKIGLQESKTFSFIISGTLVLFLGLSCNNNTDDANFSKRFPFMGTSQQDRNRLLKQLWEHQASKHELDAEIISNVSNLFYQAMNSREFIEFADSEVYQPMETKPIEESLDRYLKQFKPYFLDSEIRSGTSFWIAWLLVQCATRHHPNVDEIRETKLWFEEFKKKVSTAVDENIKITLGKEDYSKYGEQIEQTKIWIGKTLDIYFDEFHDDPLFPLFKEPLSESNEKEVLRRLVEDTGFSVFIKGRRKSMVSMEEHIVEQMETIFGHTPKKVIFHALVSSNINEWQKEKYWGGMVANATTGVRTNGIWPIEVYLRKQNSTFPGEN